VSRAEGRRCMVAFYKPQKYTRPCIIAPRGAREASLASTAERHHYESLLRAAVRVEGAIHRVEQDRAYA
jgi:hypothetical protein